MIPLAAAIGEMVAGNKHVSSTQRNQDVIVFAAVGICAALGLAAYLHFGKTQEKPGLAKDEPKSSETTTNENNDRPKDIWNVGQSSQTSLKKSNKAYKGKAFGSKYYYAHNDSNTTGGYKDGLKMEDYRMNGPRLLSKNGLSVVDNDQADSHGAVDEAAPAGAATSESMAPTRITAQEPNVKNITKYLWDDPGNAKGIATIRVDVLPGDKLGDFVDVSAVSIRDVTATLPGEGLLVKITVGDDESPSYQLKINKLYGDAAEVKVVIKPKKLLLKIYKKKHGFLSRNNDNMGAWPQPHRKI